MLQAVDVGIAHLLSHLDQRREHRIHETGTDEKRHKQQKNEEVYDQRRMEEGFRPEVVVPVCVRDAHDGDHVSLLVEQRGIECPVVVSCYTFPVDIESLVSVSDLVERLLVDPAAYNQLLEHLRRCGPEDLAAWSIQSDVHLGGIAYVIQSRSESLGRHLAPVADIPCLVRHQALHGADLGRHQIGHVLLIPLVHEGDADRRHTRQDDE